MPRGKPITAETRKSILGAFVIGEKVEYIAAQYGVVPSHVSKMARRNGLSSRLRDKWRANLAASRRRAHGGRQPSAGGPSELPGAFPWR